MSFAQTLQRLMDRDGLTNYQLAKALECHQTSVKNWLEGAKPQKLMMKKIADYFGVTADYLLTGEQKETALPSLNQKDERDIEKRLQAMLGELEGEEAGSLMYSGEPLDEETRELLRISIKNQLELSKQLAKKKFTPKKYRKEGD